MAALDYSTVTETPGNRMTVEALEMLYTRYRFAASFCEGGDVLEVACGAGQGLGYLAARAHHLVGGDYTPRLLAVGKGHYGGRVPLLRLDGQALPFRSAAFDVVVLFEAIYYLPQPHRFLCECRRVLRPGGVVVVGTVNCEWADFNPSPYSVRYYGAVELAELLERAGFEAELFGAFPPRLATGRDRVVSAVKRTAVALGLIPRTMKGKEWLKRLFFGRLQEVPAEVEDGRVEYRAPVRIATTAAAPAWKMLFALGRLPVA